jgi:hypothetical protein
MKLPSVRRMYLWTCNCWPRRTDASGVLSRLRPTSEFLAAVLIMLIIAVSLYLVFKRKKWL